MDEQDATLTPPVVAGAATWQPPTSDAPVAQLADVTTPRRSRKGLVALIAAAVLLIVGIGAFVLLRNDDKAAAFSLSAAAQTADTAKNVSYQMTIDVDGQEITADVVFDNTTKLMQFTSDLGGLLPGADNGIVIVFDLQNLTMYMDASSFQDLGLPLDTQWISLDLKQFAEMSGADTSVFDQLGAGNPLDTAALFDQAKSVREVGFEDLNGEQVKHLVVTVDIADVLTANPELQQQADDLGGDLPTEIEYDVYINEQNELRRMTFSFDIAGKTIGYDLVVNEINSDVSITVPDPSDVTDLSNMLGG